MGRLHRHVTGDTVPQAPGVRKRQRGKGRSGALPVAEPERYAAVVRIANPMYDAAFKYLMDDDASARLLVGAVLGEEVESLQALPQERAARPSPSPAPGEPPSGELLTVRRVDFAATVRTAAGDRLRVLVEVQKARFTDEIMRFREYLGRHYADRENYDQGPDGRRRHRPLRAIYILGECLPRTEATVLRVSREYLDGVTGQRLSDREEFVEALSHDCWVVQVPLLAARRRTDLERLLSVFDQELQVAGNRSLLEVDERDVPERYAPVLRRLAGAAASVEVADSMALEDEVSETWGRMKREIAADKAALAKRALPWQKRTRLWQKRTRPWRGNGRIGKRPRSVRPRWRGGWRSSAASREVRRRREHRRPRPVADRSALPIDHRPTVHPPRTQWELYTYVRRWAWA